MEPLKPDAKKIAEMVMCGDHQSLTSKGDLNVKETSDGKETRSPFGSPSLHGKMIPTLSRVSAIASSSDLEMKSRTLTCPRIQQAHVLRAAAMRGVRWAPYQLVGWALLLLAAHALAGLADVLERAMPPLRNLCEYLCEVMATSWRAERPLYAAGAGGAAGALWVTYGALRTARALALWALLPVCDGPNDTPRDVDSRNLIIDR